MCATVVAKLLSISAPACAAQSGLSPHSANKITNYSFDSQRITCWHDSGILSGVPILLSPASPMCASHACAAVAVVHLQGGGKPNAIPREAAATLLIHPGVVKTCQEQACPYADIIKANGTILYDFIVLNMISRLILTAAIVLSFFKGVTAHMCMQVTRLSKAYFAEYGQLETGLSIRLKPGVR